MLNGFGSESLVVKVSDAVCGVWGMGIADRRGHYMDDRSSRRLSNHTTA